jgi:hypothetical protein
MSKFHIVDKDLEIIDSGDNLLGLRVACKEVNERIYDAENQCEVITDRELKVGRCINADIESIKNDLLQNDAEFLYFVLKGEGFVQYDNLTDEQLDQSYKALQENELV